MRSLLVLSFLFLAGCAVTDQPTGTTADRAVRAVLDDFHQAAAEADGPRYFGHFAPDGVFIGTDATERWTVDAFRAYAEPHFSAGKGWTYRPLERHVSLSSEGSLAWFDERLWNEAYGEVRGSGVLRRIDGRFHVAQYVLSFPVPNDAAKQVVRLIRDHLESANE